MKLAGFAILLLLSACVHHPTMTVTKDGESAKVYVRPLQPQIGPDGVELAGQHMDWVEFATYKSMGALPPPIPKPNMAACLFADVVTTAAGLSTGRMVELNPLGPYRASALATAQLAYLKAADDGSDYQMDLRYFYANIHCWAALSNGIQTAAILLFIL